jgi:hypothetical protein
MTITKMAYIQVVSAYPHVKPEKTEPKLNPCHQGRVPLTRRMLQRLGICSVAGGLLACSGQLTFARMCWASRAACVRLVAFSLPMMWRMCTLTVLSQMSSS